MSLASWCSEQMARLVGRYAPVSIDRRPHRSLWIGPTPLLQRYYHSVVYIIVILLISSAPVRITVMKAALMVTNILIHHIRD